MHSASHPVSTTEPARLPSEMAVYSARLLAATLLVIFLSPIFARGQSSSWQTLDKSRPAVVAVGGFAAIFPSSSLQAYTYLNKSSHVIHCNVQFSRDLQGFCSPSILLENSTNIVEWYPNGKSTKTINGINTSGWFSVDFSIAQISQFNAMQGVYSRSSRLNGIYNPLVNVSDLFQYLPDNSIWLSFENINLFEAAGLNVTQYALSLKTQKNLKYISSDGSGFLKSIAPEFKELSVTIVSDFSGNNSTLQAVAAGALRDVAAYSSAISVDKNDIVRVTDDLKSKNVTQLVSTAHDANLQIFASNFDNDVPFSYEYRYDPTSEILDFVANDAFSVDGVLTSFPSTPAIAIDCMSYLSDSSPPNLDFLIISKHGESGMYPGCTDLAYAAAVEHVNFLDCSVQITKDLKIMCLPDMNISNFVVWSSSAPQNTSYSFDYTAAEILGFAPHIQSPYDQFRLQRNPNENGKGKFVTLEGFLDIAANASSLTGVLLKIENAHIFRQKLNISVIDAVSQALKASRIYDSNKRVLYMSSNSSVLMQLDAINVSDRVYWTDGDYRDVRNDAVAAIKNFANYVVISKNSVYEDVSFFIVRMTNIVANFNKNGVSVIVETFSNEFVSQDWDFFSDANIELNSFILQAKIQGVITDYPSTAFRFAKNRCSKMNPLPAYMQPHEPGFFYKLIPADYLPPAQAPAPIFTVPDIADPPVSPS